MGEKSFGSLIYLILRVFLLAKNETFQKKWQTLAYKALERSPWLGRSLIQAYGMMVFKKNFEEWLKKSSSHKSKNNIKARVDRSDSGKHYGKNIPGLKLLYDYVNKCKKKTHHIEVLLVSIGMKEFILDFVVIKYKKNYSKKKGKKRQGYDVTLGMLKKMLTNLGSLKDEFCLNSRLSLDGWYGKEEMLIGLWLLGLHRVVVKSGGVGKVKYQGKIYRLSELKEKLIRKRKWKSFNKCHNLGNCEYLEVIVEFVTSKMKLKCILVKYTGNKKMKKKNRYLFLLCPYLNWYHYQIVQCYKGRWPIEVMFRTSKQIFKLETYSYHINISEKETKKESNLRADAKMKNIELHFALCFIGYMWMNWYRVEYTRMSITPLKKVRKLWEKELNAMSPKAIEKLFSGYD